MSTARLGSVSLDCPDPPALAAFYAKLLGTEVAYDTETFAAIQLDKLWLSMQRVDDYHPPAWPAGDVPQQIHLDFSVDDLDTGEATAVAAGATTAAMQPSPDRWRVLIDPAGHPFCLTTLIPE
jgi:catechol 2,3-dioxygenase-like lactoylglutathione lyase family enzyme